MCEDGSRCVAAKGVLAKGVSLVGSDIDIILRVTLRSLLYIDINIVNIVNYHNHWSREFTQILHELFIGSNGPLHGGPIPNSLVGVP